MPPDLTAHDRAGLLSHPLFQLLRARLLEFAREPAALFWVYGFPLILALVLGFAFTNRPVERVTIDIVGAPESAQFRAMLAGDERVNAVESTLESAKARLRTAKTGLIIVPTAEAPGYSYILDPSRPECTLALVTAQAALARAGGKGGPGFAEPKVESFAEAGGRYIDFLLPGLIGANLMGGGLFGLGFVIVDLRVRKLLKRFLATPMSKRDFLLSLLLSRLLFTVVEVGVLLAFGVFAFGVRVRGDPVSLVLVVLLGASAFAGLGLLISSRARTMETAGGLAQAVMLPSYMASGVFFSVEQFPQGVQPVLRLLPLTALNDALRLVVNEGASVVNLGPQLLVLVAWGAGSFFLASRLFRWL